MKEFSIEQLEPSTEQPKLSEIKSDGIVALPYWSYNVTREGSDLIFTFSSHPLVRTIRQHATREYYPYADISVQAGNRVRVRPGQWIQGLVNGQWSYLTDADNR